MGKSRYKNLKPADFENVATYELASRPSKVTVDSFAKPVSRNEGLKEFLDELPDILAVRSLRAVAAGIVNARNENKPIIWGIGGHVIKTGLAPVLIDLMKRGFLTAVACNGSVLVHDSEVAMVGSTSEDVDATLGEGDFGAAKETGELLNDAAAAAIKENLGLGEALCEELVALKPEYACYSLLCAAHQERIPVTAHITIGADIGHFHASADGAALGQGSHTDFRLFTALVRQMEGGGVYLNCGSAVTLPEIFLKAITVNRNLGFKLDGLVTANFDFIQHYRPITNVVRRPNANGSGKGYSITGHHELMIPMLAAAILTTAGQ